MSILPASQESTLEATVFEAATTSRKHATHALGFKNIPQNIDTIFHLALSPLFFSVILCLCLDFCSNYSALPDSCSFQHSDLPCLAVWTPRLTPGSLQSFAPLSSSLFWKGRGLYPQKSVLQSFPWEKLSDSKVSPGLLKHAERHMVFLGAGRRSEMFFSLCLGIVLNEYHLSLFIFPHF